MNLQEILSTYLTGEPLADSLTIGIIIAVVFEFYKVVFSTIFAPFKK